MPWLATPHPPEIIIDLPLNTPTGKVRVKRPMPGHQPTPVPCVSQIMQAGDYIEWQISYDTPVATHPTALPHVRLTKARGIFYGCELVWLLEQARLIGLITPRSWPILRAFLNVHLPVPAIEDYEGIRAVPAPLATTASAHGFQRREQQVPEYYKTGPGYAVEIKLAHRQRAVGVQAMIFVHLPLSACNPAAGQPPFAGRMALSGEVAHYHITPANIELIWDTLTAFILASRPHANDIDLICRAMGI